MRPVRQRSYTRTLTLVDLQFVLDNVRDVAALAFAALPEVRPEWYVEQHYAAFSLAAKHAVSHETVCGVIAALSPNVSWERNLEVADDLLTTGDCGHPYGDSIRKARRIIAGEHPKDVLGGRKVRSFYMNLMHPYVDGPFTGDSHMTQIGFAGLNSPLLDKKGLKIIDRPGAYQLLAACVRTVAREYGVRTNEMQETLWVYWRANHAYGKTTLVEAF